MRETHMGLQVGFLFFGMASPFSSCWSSKCLAALSLGVWLVSDGGISSVWISLSRKLSCGFAFGVIWLVFDA